MFEPFGMAGEGEADKVLMQTSLPAGEAPFGSLGTGDRIALIGRPAPTDPELLLNELLPKARSGLRSYAIPDSEIDEYLDIVQARVESTQNGAAWQKRWVTRNGMRANELVLDYARMQESGDPVHTWPL